MIDTQRANEIYERIKNKLLHYKGQIVAIETDTGDYFVGNDIDDAYQKGIIKHPDKKFFFKRIGFKAVYFIGAVPR